MKKFTKPFIGLYTQQRLQALQTPKIVWPVIKSFGTTSEMHELQPADTSRIAKNRCKLSR